MVNVRERVAIVTGGATLIGQGVVRALVREGVRVVIADITEPDGVVASVMSEPLVRYIQTDIRSDSEIEACIDFTCDHFGGIDILVNLASTYVDNGVHSSREVWREALDVNLVSAFVFIDKVLPNMRERGGGSIVNFGSIAGKVAQPGRMTYSASKAAIIQATRNCAMQLAPFGVRVNSVSPGWTWSNIMVNLTRNDRGKADSVAKPFHFIGRTANPEEVGAAVVFLCSDGASFITGADIAVDGGYTSMGPEGLEDAVEKLGNY